MQGYWYVVYGFRLDYEEQQKLNKLEIDLEDEDGEEFVRYFGEEGHDAAVGIVLLEKTVGGDSPPLSEVWDACYIEGKVLKPVVEAQFQDLVARFPEELRAFLANKQPDLWLMSCDE